MTISNDRMKIIEKVIKLLALSEGTNHSAEAEAAKNMAAEFMAKHNIRQQELLKEKEIFDKKVVTATTKELQKFDIHLANCIARFNGCCLIITSGGTKAQYVFIGSDQDIEATCYMFDIIVAQRKVAHKQFEKEYLQQWGKVESEKAWRLWHNGFTVGVKHKLAEINSMSVAKQSEWGIVPVSTSDIALQWYMNENSNVRENKSRALTGSRSGYEAGKNVSLHKGVEQNKDVKQIS